MYHTTFSFSSPARCARVAVCPGHSIAPAFDRAAISYVDDPTRPMRIVRAVGTLGIDSIRALRDVCQGLSAPFHVHVDVIDAMITDTATMRALESALDQLERRRLDVRLVGVDPSHPVLAG